MTIQKATTVSGEIRPRITLTASDHERLSLLARAVAAKMPDLVSVLTEELERAEFSRTATQNIPFAWAPRWNSATTRPARFRP